MKCILVFAAVLLAAVAAAPAQAANDIVYSCDLDICTLDPSLPGGNVTNLTDNGNASIDQRPVWSPNGARVAFVSNFGNTAQNVQNVFVMQPEAAGQAINLAIQVTRYAPKDSSLVVQDLAWSPDGTRIAYTRGNNPYTVYVAAADGTSATPLPITGPGEGRHPSWSPDGTRIAYSKNDEVRIANANGSGSVPLTNGAGHEPYWSPTGQRIAFDTNNSPAFVDLHVVNADGSGTPLVVSPGSAAEWTFPAWSRDGGRLAYRVTVGEEKRYYRVMNADGTGDHPLASTAGEDDRNPSWSPDGGRVVFDARNFLAGTTNLDVVNADGSGAELPLTSGSSNLDPDWRPIPAALVPQVPPPDASAPGKPKIVWFTKRQPITAGAPIHVLIVACNAPRCSVGTTGTSRAVGPPSTHRPATISKKKPKRIVVGTGKLDLLAGQTKTAFMRLNRSGKALLEQQGKLDIEATVRITSPGQPVVTAEKTIHVVLKKPKKKGRR